VAIRDDRLPQSVDSLLVAELIRQMQVRGPLGVLGVADFVQPVYLADASDLQAPALIGQPVFPSTGVFSGIAQALTPASVLVDTNQQIAGIYDVIFGWTIAANPGGATLRFTLEHRNAANAANLASWVFAASFDMGYTFAWALRLETNERLRVVISTTFGANDQSSATIMLRRRPQQ